MTKVKQQVAIFWFRRDLRLEDNSGLFHALKGNSAVLPIFIFDTDILDQLPDQQDARVQFIHDRLKKIHSTLQKIGSSVLVKHGKPLEIFQQLLADYTIEAVFTNRDYEPYALVRDKEIEELLGKKGIKLFTFKDHVIYEKKEIVTDAGEPYKVFTPYKNKWLEKYKKAKPAQYDTATYKENFVTVDPFPFPTLEKIGFIPSPIAIPADKVDEEIVKKYAQSRNFPAQQGTSRLGIHLRHGSLSIRKLAHIASQLNETYLSELIWRDFYVMILANFPHVVERAFKPQYERIPWKNDPEEYKVWCQGKTGYPIVDAGMRELNQTGFMHNRVRMVTASFLTKHLLIDWRWGEAYFADKLLDYELASNNGGWQWAAGTGTDAQPYFRIFNPTSQMEKFDKDLRYIKKWIPEYGTSSYAKPIVAHKEARERALTTFKTALEKN